MEVDVRRRRWSRTGRNALLRGCEIGQGRSLFVRLVQVLLSSGVIERGSASERPVELIAKARAAAPWFPQRQADNVGNKL